MTSPKHPSGVRRLFRLRFTPSALHHEVEDEIRFHVESRAADLVAQGMTPEAAREQAMREYGDVAQSHRELVQVDRRRLGHERREEMLMSFTQDLRYAARGLPRRPALVAVITLALTVGIAANAIIFGVVDQLMLRPPAGVAAPAGVRRIYYQEMQDGKLEATPVTTYRAIIALRDNVTSATDIAGYFRTSFTLGHGVDASRVDAELVSGNYFRLLGVRPQLGRAFTPEEDVPPQGPLVAIVSDGFWRSTLGARPDVIGQRLELKSKEFTIVGVAPPGFTGLDRQRVDLWIPIAADASESFGDDWYSKANTWWVQVIARLRPEATPALLATQATTAYRHEVASWEGKRDTTATVLLGPLVGVTNPGGMSAESKVSLWLMGVSVIVLLIACANVANLLIARTLQRRREIAVRLALGVSRGRLMRQLLTESALLASVAAGVALLVAHWGSRLVQQVLLPGIVWSGSVLDARILAFTLVTTLACILLAGLAPAFEGIHTGVSDALKASSRQVAGGRGLLRTSLLVTQAALTVVLLVGAGLFVKSLRNVTSRDVGITLDKVLLVTMNLDRAGFTKAQIDETFATAAERVRAMPGVRQAALVSNSVPMRSAYSIEMKVPGVEKLPKLSGGGPYYAMVTDDYFDALGSSLRAGRLFTPEEERAPSRVMLINEALAKGYWPGKNPVGQCVALGKDSTCTQIVGVVQNVLLFNMVKDDRALVYLPPSHPAYVRRRQTAAMFVRAVGDPAALVPLIRNELQRLAPNMPYVQVTPFAELVAPQLRPWRLGATMFTLFGVIALVIAAVGLYSVMAYWVSQRTHEIGVRMALGALRADVIRLVAMEALRPIVAGLILGGLVTAVASRWVADMLYETSPRDPWVYGIAAGVLAVAALAASIVPARRSAAVDPASSLRAD